MHVGPTSPTTEWDISFDVPWWRDHARYRVGALTARACRVRLCNVLTHGTAAQPDVSLEVPRPACPAAPRRACRPMSCCAAMTMQARLPLADACSRIDPPNCPSAPAGPYVRLCLVRKTLG